MSKPKKFRKVPADVPVSHLTPLNIVCGSTKCQDGLHCFSLKKSTIKKHGKEGVCIECGIDLIEWDRIHKNNLNDAKFIFQSMKNELIRHVFWHTPIEKLALEKAKIRGRKKIKEKAKNDLISKVKRLNPAGYDSRQTPMGGTEIVNYARHATATCCRRCIEAWYNIPQKDILSDKQINFFTDLIMMYIDERVPNLPEEEQKIKKA